MPQFKLRPEAFAKVKKRIIIRFAVIFVVCFVLVTLASGQQNKVDAATNAVTAAVIFLFLIVIYFFSIRRSLKYAKLLYDSYTFIIEGNTLTRLQQNTPAISFNFNEVKTISKTSKGNLIITGTKPGDIIYIPPTVENPAEMEQLLAGIQPISKTAAISFIVKYNLPISVLVIAMMICVYAVNNKVIVGVSGTVVSLVLVWGLYDTQANKNIDTKTKRNMLWTLVVLLSVITVTIIKLRR